MIDRGHDLERAPDLRGPEAPARPPAAALPGATAGAALHAPLAQADPGMAEAFGDLPAPEPARTVAKGPWVTEPTPFREAAPTRLRLDPARLAHVVKSAALAASMALTSAAGTPPRHFPSEEAHLLAKLQIHDSAVESYRHQVERVSASQEAEWHQGVPNRGLKGPGLEGARPGPPSPNLDTLRGGVALAGAIALSMFLDKLLKEKKEIFHD